jgi:hypothetical protein
VDQEFFDSIEHVFAYEFRMKKRVPEGDSWQRRLGKWILGDRGTFYLRLAKVNPFSTASVVKDPTASFLGGYLRARFNAHPITVVKHPVSLAASLRRLGWVPSPHWFKSQPDLLEDHGPLVEAVLDLDWNDPITAAAAHWCMVYGVQLAQAAAERAKDEPAWEIVVLEELSRNPVSGARRLYSTFGLPWSDNIARRIQKMTTEGGGEARPGQMQDLRRDSARIFETRRQQLSLEERRRVFDITGDIALQLYSEASFAI